MNHDAVRMLIACLMHGQIASRVLHWKTESLGEHKALGKLYSILSDSMDTYADSYMGIYGRFGDVKVEVAEIGTANELIEYLSESVLTMRDTLPNDTQLQNLIDELAAGIDRIAYLLTLK
jgi:hypothetical protein